MARMKVDKRVLNDFQSSLEKIVDDFVKNNGVEIFGNLRIEVADMDDLALVKGNTIYINISVREFPEHVLKYVVAHELAHLVLKRHTKRFWDIVKDIYPQYEKGKDELARTFNKGKTLSS